MKLALLVNGVAREIDTNGTGNEIVAVEPGVYSVLADGRSYEARVEEEGERLVVFIEGHRFEIEVRDPRRWSRKSAGRGMEGRLSLTAPMPGKIVRLLVAEGDSVAPGQGLVVVEAMKMQNELKAPRAGRVSAIEVNENDSVNAGAVLATIE